MVPDISELPMLVDIKLLYDMSDGIPVLRRRPMGMVRAAFRHGIICRTLVTGGSTLHIFRYFEGLYALSRMRGTVESSCSSETLFFHTGLQVLWLGEWEQIILP